MSDAPTIFSEDYYARLDALQQKHWWCRGMRRIQAALLEQLLPKNQPIDVLDAGCGTASSFPWIRQHVPGLRRLVGFDVSLHALSLGQTRNYQALVCQASVLNVPFKSSIFDLIICDDVLQHVYSADARVLSEFYRVLRPGGLLLLRTNARHLLASNDDPAWDFHRYSRRELVEKAQKMGFAVVRCSYVNALPSLIAEWRNVSNSIKKAEQGAYTGLRLEAKRSYFHELLYGYMAWEAILISRLGITLPLGHSLVVMLKKNFFS